MDVKERLYSSYITSGQAGGTVINQLEQEKVLFANNEPYINQLIERYIPPDRNVRIVDLGCGHGTYLYFLKQKGYRNLVGIDASEEQVALAHRLNLEEVHCGDIRDFLEHDNKSVDIVLLMDILEHLELENIVELLDKIFLKLKKGGRLIIHVPNAEGLFGMRVRYGDLTHERSFTPTSMQQLLKTVGFSTITYSEDKPIIHGMKSLVRRVLWDVMTAPHHLLLMAETGDTNFVLTQNMLVIAQKET